MLVSLKLYFWYWVRVAINVGSSVVCVTLVLSTFSDGCVAPS
jgi:hypothetical protein